MTRGHNIVADGWAGASNPHSHPTQMLKKHLKRLLPHFSTRGHGRTDGRTDKVSYRVALAATKNEHSGYFLSMFVYGVGFGVWMRVGCPCPPVRNDIVTPRHLFDDKNIKLQVICKVAVTSLTPRPFYVIYWEIK